MILCGIITIGLVLGMFLLRRNSLWEKIKNPYKIFLVFSVLGMLSSVLEQQKTGVAESGKIYRNAPGEGELETELQVLVPEEDTEYTVNLAIEEKIFTPQEEQEKIQATIEEIEKSFCGENSSLDEIRTNPVVLESYQNAAVTAEWDFSEECISAGGVIDKQALGDEEKLVEAEVRLTCGESTGDYQFYFCLVPEEKTKKEQLMADIQKQIAEQETTTEEIVLPKQAGGKAVYWEEVTSRQPLEILCVGIFAAIATAYVAREQELKKMAKRKERLLLEYPEFVSKLSLLLGAGMNITAAFRKINQMHRKNNKNDVGYVYTELQQMLYEIDNGMGEMRAYREFAERCDLQPYRKLMSLLQSGQKVGNRELIGRLNEEADRVFAERKNTARKLGEEAGTKLLAPMMMMLVIVMGIVIFPAFLSIYNM